MEIHSTYVCEKTFDFLGIFIYLDSCWWGKEGWARKVGQGRLGKEGQARKVRQGNSSEYIGCIIFTRFPMDDSVPFVYTVKYIVFKYCENVKLKSKYKNQYPPDYVI